MLVAARQAGGDNRYWAISCAGTGAAPLGRETRLAWTHLDLPGTVHTCSAGRTQSVSGATPARQQYLAPPPPSSSTAPLEPAAQAPPCTFDLAGACNIPRPPVCCEGGALGERRIYVDYVVYSLPCLPYCPSRLSPKSHDMYRFAPLPRRGETTTRSDSESSPVTPQRRSAYQVPGPAPKIGSMNFGPEWTKSFE